MVAAKATGAAGPDDIVTQFAPGPRLKHLAVKTSRVF